MQKKMKIGVLGGTFNPIHNSHIYLAHEYAKQLNLDKIIIVPAYLPPHKKAENLAGSEDRLNMCRLATQGMELFHILDFELNERGKSYTYKTLRYILEKHPNSELYLIMGGDMFITVQDWKLAPEIFRMAILCGGQRKRGERTLMDIHRQTLEARGARCVILDLEAKPLSSTQVREKIAAGEDPKNLLHPEVWKYIVDNKLYFSCENGAPAL